MTLLPRRKLTILLQRGSAPYFFVVVLYVLALAARWWMLDFDSVDYNNFLFHWITHIQSRGIFAAYATDFSDYAPLYTYFLGAGSLFSAFLPPLYIVKLVTFAGEVVAALFAYKIAMHHRHQEGGPLTPGVVAMLMMLSPSLLVNGALIGQCDIWFTAFLFAAVYYMLKDHSILVFVYFGLAVSFKLQALFLGPLLLAYMLKHPAYWRNLWIVPAMYVLTCIPAWLQGRPFIELLLIYWTKYSSQSTLGLRPWMAPNVYAYLDDIDTQWVRNAGVLAAIIAGGLIAYITSRRWRNETSAPAIMLLATLCCGLMPFILPGMFNRYFFAADSFSFLLACLRPRWFFITICFQYASLVTVLDVWQFPFLKPWLWPHHSQMQRIDVAACINAVAVAITLGLCILHVWMRPAWSLSKAAAR